MLLLDTVFLHVTKACNLRCAYCYFSADKPLFDELGLEEFAGVWPQLVAVRPQKVVFTGGEPLLRPDLLDLLRGLRDADPAGFVRRCLNTNGVRMTANVAQNLVGLIDEVRVSIDALGARNDSLRGNGTFAAAVTALETLHAEGFEPKALVTVTSATLPDLEELICFLHERKITRINLNLFRPIGRGSGHSELMVRPSDVHAAVLRAWERSHSCEPAPPELPKMEMQGHCGVGHFLNIMPNGDVFPCHVLTQPEFRCGRLRQETLLEICKRSGLLATLAGLDFHQLVTKDGRLRPLMNTNACMGEVYERTRTSGAWRDGIKQLSRDV